MTRVQNVGGFEIKYQSSTALEILKREFQDDRTYERAGISLSNDDYIFDVGANIGFFLLYLNRALKRAHVYCFEPIPPTFQLLQWNCERNNRLTTTLLPFALGEQIGRAKFTHFPEMNVNSSMRIEDSAERRREARLFVFEEMRKRSRVCRLLFCFTPQLLWWPVVELLRIWGTRSETVTCEIRTLSSVLDEQLVPRIDLLKIDVEGAEEDVLRGIREEHWPLIRQIMIETHFGKEQSSRVAAELRRRKFEVEITSCVDGIDHLQLVVGKRSALESYSGPADYSDAVGGR